VIEVPFCFSGKSGEPGENYSVIILGDQRSESYKDLGIFLLLYRRLGLEKNNLLGDPEEILSQIHF